MDHRNKLAQKVAVLLIAGAVLAAAPARAAADPPIEPAPEPVLPLPPVEPEPAAAALDPRVIPFLEPPDFYRAVGRPDLASSYENRRASKTVLRVGGGVLLGGGILVGLIAAAATSIQNSAYAAGCVTGSSTDCQASSSASGVPWAVALLGLGMLIVPACYETDPLTPSEKAALLNNLAAPAPTRPSLSLSVTPAPAPGGGTLIVGGRF